MKNNTRKIIIVACLLIITLALSGCGRRMHRMVARIHGEHFGQMHEFGRGFMPFSGDEQGMRGDSAMMIGVSHIFDKTDEGGVYQVIADDADDAETIAMIQERLSRMVEGAHAQAPVADNGEAKSNEDTETETEKTEETEETEDAEANNAESNDETVSGHQKQKRGMHGLGLFGHGMHVPGMNGRGMGGIGAFMEEITIAYSDLDDGGQITISSENPEVVTLIHQWIEVGPMRKGMQSERGSK